MGLNHDGHVRQSPLEAILSASAVLFEVGRVDAARMMLNEALNMAEQTQNPPIIIQAILEISRILEEAGWLLEARLFVQEAIRSSEKNELVEWKRIAEAQLNALDMALMPLSRYEILYQPKLIECRILLEKGQEKEAIQKVMDLQQNAQTSERLPVMIEILIESSRLLNQINQREQAVGFAQQALELARKWKQPFWRHKTQSWWESLQARPATSFPPTLDPTPSSATVSFSPESTLASSQDSDIGKIHEATSPTGEVAAALPGSPESQNIQAELLIMKGQVQEAKQALQEAVGQKPDHIGILNNLAIVYVLEKDWEKAEGQLRRVLSLDPGNEVAVENLNAVKLQQEFQRLVSEAETNIEEGRFDRATHLLQRVLRLEPLHIGAINDMGVVELMKGNLEQAGEYFQQVLAIDSENSIAKENLKLLQESPSGPPGA